jgi:hypothetical protein
MEEDDEGVFVLIKGLASLVLEGIPLCVLRNIISPYRRQTSGASTDVTFRGE